MVTKGRSIFCSVVKRGPGLSTQRQGKEKKKNIHIYPIFHYYDYVAML